MAQGFPLHRHARVVRDYSDLVRGGAGSIDIYFRESFRVDFRGLLSEVGLNNQCTKRQRHSQLLHLGLKDQSFCTIGLKIKKKHFTYVCMLFSLSKDSLYKAGLRWKTSHLCSRLFLLLSLQVARSEGECIDRPLSRSPETCTSSRGV